MNKDQIPVTSSRMVAWQL